jgi:hypothetical protein
MYVLLTVLCLKMFNSEKCRYRRPTNSQLRRVNPVFHIQNQETDTKELSSHQIRLAWKSGQLNLSGRGLASGTPSFKVLV